MASKSTLKNDKKCLKCTSILPPTDFYSSLSPLHGDGRVPYCKSCLQKMVDVNNIATVIEALRAIDKPFLAKLWQSALEKSSANPFGLYMRGLTLPQNKTLTWKDGEAENIKNVTQIANEINKKNKELEDKSKEKEIADVPQELIEKWGIGYSQEEYVMFEKKYKLLEGSYPIRSTMHLEALITYVRYRVKEEIATSKNDIASAKQWGALAKDQATSAKINPSQLTASDLSQGLDTFSQLVQEVEKAVDIIPILPQFLSKPKDKVDFTVLCYVNYERHLRGLPLVEYADVYDFYNKMVEDYIQSNPTDYAFLLDEEVKGDTLVERVYHYVFDVVIPKKKAENPNVTFYQHLDKWVELVSFYRFYPDLWIDLITPKTGGIRLDLDQRVLMRSMARFKKIYTVLPRGYGKTFIQSLSGFHTLTFFPNIDICMTAQTKENASALIKDKFAELMKFYPMLKEETIEKKNRFADNLSEVYWKSGGKMDSLANAQSSKGQRRKRMVVEESALLNNKLFEDALEPIVNVPRRTIGRRAIISPIELNGQITFFTTSGYRGSSEYERNLKMADDMTELKGVMIFGSDFELASSMGRGEPKAVILGKKETLSPSAFAMNYMSHWVGSTEGALININKAMDLRTVTKAELKGDGKSEYILGVDVARSQKKNNNQSSVAVLKIQRNKKGKIVNVRLVNIINMDSTINFTTLAIEVMRLKDRYDAKAIVVDSNGLGVGLVDELLKEQFDPITNESLGCYDTINTDQEPELDDAEECVYALKSQAINTQVIVNFMDYIESEKLQLLEKRNDVGYDINDDDYIKKEVLPFVQTDLLLDEIANLQLENLGNSGLKVKQVTKAIDKDRYSALAYALWYIKNFEEGNGFSELEGSAADYLFIN